MKKIAWRRKMCGDLLSKSQPFSHDFESREGGLGVRVRLNHAYYN